MMEIRLLEYFLAVVREESINKAAEAIHISQPTLSRQLAQLEDEVGVQLLVRGNKGIQLTEEGLLLKRRAEEILELVEKTGAELREQDSLVEGKITVGWGEMASVGIVASLIREFMKRYPAVSFDTITETADVTLDGMDRGTVDVGLLLEPVNMEKYEFVRLSANERWAAIIKADDPLAQKESVTAEDLLSRTILLPRRLSVQSELASWFGQRYSDLDSRISVNLSTNCAVMVEQGMGIGLTIEGALPYLDARKVVLRPLEPELKASSVLAWKRHQPFGVAARKFIQFVCDSEDGSY